jgi:uncharacterized protein YgbK (DUF1537 family)
MNAIDPRVGASEKLPKPSTEMPAAGVELSSLEADEMAFEQIAKKEGLVEKVGEQAGATAAITSAVPTQAQVQALEKDQITFEVENILETDLKELYVRLPEDVRPIFKKKGEETAQAISKMIKTATVKLGEVMKLVLSWLKIIPKVNVYYLEQEAKIKADRIMGLSQQIAADNPKT